MASSSSSPRKPRRRPSLAKITRAAEEGAGIGYCIKCWGEHGTCEPDARKYPCEDGCGNTVYGAEELVLMLAF